jgi:glycosyltransferase involved in cell wall biosynthesis
VSQPPAPAARPLRVLMISKACVVGAYQRKLEAIAAHPGVDLTVVVPPFWKDARGVLPLERAYTEGYRLVVEPLRFNGSFHLHHYPGLARRFDEARPDLVHVDEEPYNLATFQAVRLARRAGARSVFFSWQNIERRYPPPFAWIERWVLRHADAGIAGTREAADVWRRKGYGGPLTVIPQFGVDPDLFAPARERPPGDPFVFGYAGRLVPEKGLDLLIRALARVPGRWVLRLLGEGPQRAELQELAGVYNVGGGVRFELPIPSTDMPAFYHGLDAFVLPSLTRPNWKEQFGRVLIEAMACGVPVIGSDSGAIPEVIGGAGLIFPEGDEETLRGHLARLMASEETRRALSGAGRTRVLAHFTQTQIAARTVAVYRQVAGESG